MPTSCLSGGTRRQVGTPARSWQPTAEPLEIVLLCKSYMNRTEHLRETMKEENDLRPEECQHVEARYQKRNRQGKLRWSRQGGERAGGWRVVEAKSSVCFQEWRSVGNVVRLSIRANTERCPLDLTTERSLVTLTRALSLRCRRERAS